MRIGKRLFPYPVLNNDKSFSLYKASTFELDFNMYQTGDKIIFSDIKYNLDNHTLNRLIMDDKVEVICIIECSSTVYRTEHVITDSPESIKVDSRDLNGKFSISAYAYAKESLTNFYDTDFDEDYVNYEFGIEQYDILAVDDGVTTKVVYDEESDDKVSSIFLVTKNLNEDAKYMEVSLTTKRIEIAIPEKQFNFYDKLKINEYYRNIFFTFFIVPSLTYAIETLKDKSNDINSMNYDWFISIRSAYKEQTDTELDDEEFQQVPSIEIVQILMDSPIIKGMDELMDLVLNKNLGDDDE